MAVHSGGKIRDYEIVKAIGEGSFGKALLVKNKSGDKLVVKEIKMQKMSLKEKRETKREVDLLARLKHPYIVSYVESFEDAGNLYIVMEYCDGGDLHQKIQSKRGRQFTEDQILDWFVMLALALKHCHDRKILHRDIKSSNIFLTQDGTVKLGDFGIARVLNSTSELAKTLIGTPYYLSPEICENKPYNNKSDIWAMGCVLYELCTLKHAFDAGNVRNLAMKIIRGSYPPISAKFSVHMRNLVAATFKKSPRDRPAVNTILRMPFLSARVEKWLTPEIYSKEFAHTILHKENILHAQPVAQQKPVESPKPQPAQPVPSSKPSSKPSSSSSNSKPASPAAPAKYDPASVYGKPLVKRNVNGANRRSNEMLTPNALKRAEDKRKALEAQAEANKKLLMNKQKEIHSKVKASRMNKARENSWRDLLSYDSGGEDKTDQDEDMIDGEVKSPFERLRQDYQAYLAADVRKRKASPGDAMNKDWPDPAAIKRVIHNPDDPVNFRRETPVVAEKNEINRAAKLDEPIRGGGDAANEKRGDNLVARIVKENEEAAKARLMADRVLPDQMKDKNGNRQVQEFLDARRQYEANKARGNRAALDVFGQGIIKRHNVPSATPVGGQWAVQQQMLEQKRKQQMQQEADQMKQRQEDVDYLEKLRQVRMQNLHQRKNVPENKEHVPYVARVPGSDEMAIERKKRMEMVKAHADQRAERLRQQLQKKREDAYAQEKKRLEQQKLEKERREVQNLPDNPTPTPAHFKPLPARPLPVRISSANTPRGAAGPNRPVEPVVASPAPSVTAALNLLADAPKQQHREKTEILKRLNEKMLPEKDSNGKEEEDLAQQKSKWAGAAKDFTFSDVDIKAEHTFNAVEPSQAANGAQRKWGVPPAGKVTYSKLPVLEDLDAIDSLDLPESSGDSQSDVTKEIKSAWSAQNKMTFSNLPVFSGTKTSVTFKIESTEVSTSAESREPSEHPKVASPEEANEGHASPQEGSSSSVTRKGSRAKWRARQMETFSKVPVMAAEEKQSEESKNNEGDEFKTPQSSADSKGKDVMKTTHGKSDFDGESELFKVINKKKTEQKADEDIEELVSRKDVKVSLLVESLDDETSVKVEEKEELQQKPVEKAKSDFGKTIGTSFLVTGMLQGLFDTKNYKLMRTCSEPDVRLEEDEGIENYKTALVNRFSLEDLEDSSPSSSNSDSIEIIKSAISPEDDDTLLKELKNSLCKEGQSSQGGLQKSSTLKVDDEPLKIVKTKDDQSEVVLDEDDDANEEYCDFVEDDDEEDADLLSLQHSMAEWLDTSANEEQPNTDQKESSERDTETPTDSKDESSVAPDAKRGGDDKDKDESRENGNEEESNEDVSAYSGIDEEWISDEGSIVDEETDDVINEEEDATNGDDDNFDQLEEERMELEDLIGRPMVKIYRQVQACFDSNPKDLSKMKEVAQVLIKEECSLEDPSSAVERIVDFVIREAGVMSE